MPQGACIIVSPGFESKGESSIPLKLKRIKVCKRDDKIQEDCNEKWPILKRNLIARRKRLVEWDEESLKTAMLKRDEMADLILPSLPKQVAKTMMEQPKKDRKRQKMLHSLSEPYNSSSSSD